MLFTLGNLFLRASSVYTLLLRELPLRFLFIPTSIIIGSRYFFNSAACARGIGSMGGIEKNNRSGQEEDWR